MPATSPTSIRALPSTARLIAALQATAAAIIRGKDQYPHMCNDAAAHPACYADQVLAAAPGDGEACPDAVVGMLLGALQESSTAVKSGAADPAAPALAALRLVHATVPLAFHDLDEVAAFGTQVPAEWRAERAR